MEIRSLFHSVMTGMFCNAHNSQIGYFIIAFVAIHVVNLLVSAEYPPYFVLHKDSMIRIQPLCIALRVRRVSATVFVTAALAYRKNFEHTGIIQRCFALCNRLTSYRTAPPPLLLV